MLDQHVIVPSEDPQTHSDRSPDSHSPHSLCYRDLRDSVIFSFPWVFTERHWRERTSSASMSKSMIPRAWWRPRAASEARTFDLFSSCRCSKNYDALWKRVGHFEITSAAWNGPRGCRLMWSMILRCALGRVLKDWIVALPQLHRWRWRVILGVYVSQRS